MLALITVTSLEDNTTAGDGFTTLREAIEDAELTPDADIIEFSTIPANNFGGLTLDGGTISMLLNEFDITKSVTIDASMLTGGLTIDAQQNSRVFRINLSASGANEEIVILQSLTITGGSTIGGGSGDGGGGHQI